MVCKGGKALCNLGKVLCRIYQALYALGLVTDKVGKADCMGGKRVYRGRILVYGACKVLYGH